MFRFRKTYSILLFMLFFASCQTNINSTELPIATISETSVNIITHRPTTTRGPTRTPAPSRTPTLTPTITLTPNPTWASVQSTETYFNEQFRATEEAIKSLNPALNDCYSVSASRNNQLFSCIKTIGELLIYKEETLQITISQNDIYPNSTADTFIVPFRWSNDNVTLYFTATTCCKDGGDLWGGNLYNGLWKLNTQSHSINTIIKNNDEYYNSSLYFSISPTERRLIYIDQFERPLTINILDFKEGTTEKVVMEEKFEEATQVLWSEDGTQVIFVALSGYHFAFTPASRTSLLWLDVTSLEIRELIINSTYMLTPKSWDANNIITLRAETGTDYVATDGAYWYYDLNNNILLTEKP